MLQLTRITRAYRTAGDRRRAISQLRRRGYWHFVEYRDAHDERRPFGLVYMR